MVGQGKRLFQVGVKLVQIVTGSRVVGALCVIEYEGKVVFVRHTYGNRRLWQFPGGRLKAGESPRAAILRELMEELSIEPEHLKSLGTTQVKMGRNVTVLHLFAGQLGSQQICIDGIEIAEYRFYAPRHPPRGLGPGARTALRHFRDHLSA